MQMIFHSSSVIFYVISFHVSDTTLIAVYAVA